MAPSRILPTARDVERYFERACDLEIDYDKTTDILSVYRVERKPAVSFDVNGEIWLRFIPASGEVVGLEIEDFKRFFLKHHPQLLMSGRTLSLPRRQAKAGTGDAQTFLKQIAELLQRSFPLDHRNAPRHPSDN